VTESVAINRATSLMPFRTSFVVGTHHRSARRRVRRNRALCPWNRRHCELQLEPNRGLIDLLNARRCCCQTSANRFARHATDERSVQSEICFAVSRPSSSQVAFESCRLRP